MLCGEVPVTYIGVVLVNRWLWQYHLQISSDLIVFRLCWLPFQALKCIFQCQYKQFWRDYVSLPYAPFYRYPRNFYILVYCDFHISVFIYIFDQCRIPWVNPSVVQHFENNPWFDGVKRFLVINEKSVYCLHMVYCIEASAEFGLIWRLVCVYFFRQSDSKYFSKKFVQVE